jgi:DNA-binding transcriptional MerR regulator
VTKTKTKSMTISDLSRVTGVSGASITALAKKWKLKPTKTGEYNRKYYGAKDCQRIIDYYQSKAKTGTKTTKTATKDDLIEALREQVKDQKHQIDQLNEQLKMAQINLNQSQQLQLRQADQIKRLEAPQQATGSHESYSEQDDKEKSKSEPKDVKKAPSKPENDKGKTTIKEKILNFFQKS